MCVYSFSVDFKARFRRVLCDPFFCPTRWNTSSIYCHHCCKMNNTLCPPRGLYRHCFASVLPPVPGRVVDERGAALPRGEVALWSPTRGAFTSVLALFGRRLLFAEAALKPTCCPRAACSRAHTRPSGQRACQVLPRCNSVAPLSRDRPVSEDEQELDGLPQVDVLPSWERCVLGWVRRTCYWDRWKIHKILAFRFHYCR